MKNETDTDTEHNSNGETIGGSTADDLGEERTEALPSDVDPDELTDAQEAILREAVLHPNSTQTEIAEGLDLSAPYVSSTLEEYYPTHPSRQVNNPTTDDGDGGSGDDEDDGGDIQCGYCERVFGTRDQRNGHLAVCEGYTRGDEEDGRGAVGVSDGDSDAVEATDTDTDIVTEIETRARIIRRTTTSEGALKAVDEILRVIEADRDSEGGDRGETEDPIPPWEA